MIWEAPAKILDCTFRDGGYHTNWEFDLGLVREYLAEVPADIVEIGFAGQDRGPFSRVDDDLLEKLNPSKPIAVMLNVGDEYHGEGADMIRVATHLDQLDEAREMLERYGDRLVALNVMRAHLASRTILSSLEADIVYFADSYGNMTTSDVVWVAGALNGTLGFHAHNNTNRALVNAQRAVQCGVEWIDTTVQGIGRGAGNLPLEWVRPFEMDLGIPKTWGWDIIYHIGALYDIHPSDVQRLHADLFPSM